MNTTAASTGASFTRVLQAGLYERAGELYEYLGRSQEAMTAYRRGKSHGAFRSVGE